MPKWCPLYLITVLVLAKLISGDFSRWAAKL